MSEPLEVCSIHLMNPLNADGSCAACKTKAAFEEKMRQADPNYWRARAETAEADRDKARQWTDEDKPLPEDEAISAAHPVRSGAHEAYAEAMRLVGAKRSKAALVDLVCWLLQERDKAKENTRKPIKDWLASHPDKTVRSLWETHLRVDTERLAAEERVKLLEGLVREVLELPCGTNIQCVPKQSLLVALPFTWTFEATEALEGEGPR